MKKLITGVLLVFGFSSPVFAAGPQIDFSAWTGGHGTFNAGNFDQADFGIPSSSSFITASGWIYTGGTAYNQSGQLWMRNNTNDQGLGYCSEGLSNCTGSSSAPYNYGVNGRGDWNELGNNNADEVIRLELASGYLWSDLWVSSLDTGGTNSNESGIVYWSNDAVPDLSSITTFVKFSALSTPGVAEGSIWDQVSSQIDVTAKYVYFRADPGNGTNGIGNNDYLIYGVGVTPVPEPEIYAMLAAGLGLLGWARRRESRRDA